MPLARKLYIPELRAQMTPDTKTPSDPKIPHEPRARQRFHRDLLERAKYLDESGGKLLRRKKQELPAVVAEALQTQWQTLHLLMTQKTKDTAALLTAAETFDRALDEHLGKWRKSASRETMESILWALLLTFLIRAFVFEAFKIPTGSMIPTLQIHDHLFVNKFLYGFKIPFTRVKFLELRAPHRGEVIVFEYPYDDDPDSSGKDLIKRVIGVPGDRVRLIDNVIQLNGKPIPRKITTESSDCGQEGSGYRCRVARECLDGTVYTTQHHIPGGGQLDNSPDWPTPYPTWMAGPHASIYTQQENKNFPDFVVPEGNVLVMGDNRDNSKDGRFFGLVPFNTIKGKAGIFWFATKDQNCEWMCAPDFSRIGSLVHESAPGGTCDNF